MGITHHKAVRLLQYFGSKDTTITLPGMTLSATKTTSILIDIPVHINVTKTTLIDITVHQAISYRTAIMKKVK